jgi:hypothetical protein
VPYHITVTELTKDASGEFGAPERLGEAIAIGSMTRIWDDTGPGKPVRVFVRDLAPEIQERVQRAYDFVTKTIDGANAECEALDREYGPVWYPPIKRDGPPAWLIRKPAPAR